MSGITVNFKSSLLILTLASLMVILVSQVPTNAMADVSSPKKQINIGIDITDVICKTNLVKVYRINADTVGCFTPSSAQKLIDSGIAQEIPKDRLEAKKSFRQAPPIGTIKEIATIKQFGSEGKLSTQLRVVDYLFVFEVCAKDKTIRAPEVLINSDSEAKTVRLAQKVPANECFTNSVKIKAKDPESISAVLTNKGMITDKLNELEAKISDLQKKINTLKTSLPDMAKQGSGALNADTKKKVTETTNEISKLRTELNQAKGDLNQYLFSLHAPKQLKATEFTKQKLTLTGVPLTGTSANIMTVTKQVTGNSGIESVTQTLHNVVFEACAGNEVLRAPEVKLTSDMEEKTVRISERIIANSCQMSTAKIHATDMSSITLSIANRSDISMKITQLDVKIGQLLDEQRTYQLELKKLVVQSEKPSDYEKKVTELSNKIIQLRNQINEAKFQLYGSQYEIYKNP
ncbi:MAG: hypothetical protein OEM89_04980 [Nitrosopumilus sp.]|nr:hypothetical protein [Nitrosopumilus sp.]